MHDTLASEVAWKPSFVERTEIGFAHRNCTSQNETEATPASILDLIFIQGIPRRQEFQAIKHFAIFRRVRRA